MPTVKTKAKPKSKSKSKSKTHAATKPKSKTKSAVKSTTKSKTKAKVKAKPKPKPIKSKSKPTHKRKTQHHAFSEAEQVTLLEWVQKIVDLRRHDRFGLRSLAAIERILDHYNQSFTDAHEKFVAILELGVQRKGKIDSGLIALPDEGKDAIALYALLAEVGEEKADFQEAKKKINTIYDESLLMHQKD